MASLYNHRIVMSGWIFLAVVFASLWRSDSPMWGDLVGWLEGTTDSEAIVAVALAVAGLGAPQAFGFLSERLSCVLGLLLPRLWRWLTRTRLLGRRPSDEAKDTDLQGWTNRCTNAPANAGAGLRSEDLLGLLLNGYAPPGLLAYWEWKRTQAGASGSALVSVLGGAAVAWAWLDAFAWDIFFVVLAATGLLLYHVWENDDRSERVAAAWANAAAPCLGQERRPPQDPPEPPA